MKRKQTAKEQGENEHGRKWQAEQSEAGHVMIVGEELRKLMGGFKLCREEELTRTVLLEFLKSQQRDIKEVKGLVEVTVQTMAGVSFGVTLGEGGRSNSNVCALKAEIEEAEGTLRHTDRSFSCWLRARRRGAKSLCRMISRSRLRVHWRCA